MPAIDVAGNLEANVNVHGRVDRPIKINGVLLSGKTIKINTTLGADAPITITNATGLQGQIIINALAVTEGQWLGDVKVGSTTLSPEPYYYNLPSTVGGGAVGLAGFSFHGPACAPAHLSAVWPPPASASVDHYGPVIIASSPALKIEHRPIGSGLEDWTDQTIQFSIVVEGALPFRHVIVTPNTGFSFLADKEYRIQPQFDNGVARLKCLYGNNTVGVLSYDYRFYTVPPWDMNGDGFINSTDVALWPSNPRDFDADSTANAVDFGLLVQKASP